MFWSRVGGVRHSQTSPEQCPVSISTWGWGIVFWLMLKTVFDHAIYGAGKLHNAIHHKLQLFGFSVMWEGLEGGLFVLNINVVYRDLLRFLLSFLPDPESDFSLPKPQRMT